jgi:hypothetical protein
VAVEPGPATTSTTPVGDPGRLRTLALVGVVIGAGGLSCGGFGLLGSLAATADAGPIEVAQAGAVGAMVCGGLLLAGSATVLRGRPVAGLLRLWAVLRVSLGTFSLAGLFLGYGVGGPSGDVGDGLMLLATWELGMLVYAMAWFSALRGV